ncbi:hypothetical protein D9611_005416 [Ephemerocybe angulata]|uniref:Uncharacterized protein n=1 Tax=Ephemerocybe angulata TaxID=980116 RepID=A0A8H5FDI0_9AGAR|nr:hypothetical protein D9611_005416 [Tulosesus angulatus]
MALNFSMPGIQYSISSPFHEGDIMQFENGTSGGLASLGVDVHDISQQWIFHPTGVANAYNIENWEYAGIYVSSETVPSSAPLIRVTSSTQSKTWFFRPDASGVGYNVCADEGCSLVWSPYSNVGGPADANDVALTPATGAAYERWGMSAVGTASTRATSPTTTSTSSSNSTSSTSTTSTTFMITSTSQPPIPSSSTSSSSTGSDPPTSTDSSPDPQTVKLLAACYPCGSSHCSFTPSNSSNPNDSSETYSILIGKPVANCNSGSQETTTTTLGGTYELERSYSIAQTSGAGLGLLGPSINVGVTVTKGKSEKIVESQEIEVGIRPGQIGALVANVTYTATPGDMKVDSRCVFHAFRLIESL